MPPNRLTNMPSHITKIHEKEGSRHTFHTPEGVTSEDTSSINDVVAAHSNPEAEMKEDASNFMGEIQVGVKAKS
jgi:hypothetical protein